MEFNDNLDDDDDLLNKRFTVGFLSSYFVSFSNTSATLMLLPLSNVNAHQGKGVSLENLSYVCTDVVHT